MLSDARSDVLRTLNPYILVDQVTYETRALLLVADVEAALDRIREARLAVGSNRTHREEEAPMSEHEPDSPDLTNAACASVIADSEPNSRSRPDFHAPAGARRTSMEGRAGPSRSDKRWSS